MFSNTLSKPFLGAIICALGAFTLFDPAVAQTPASAPAQDSPKPSEAPPTDKGSDPTVITAHVAAPSEAVMPGPSADTIKAARAAGYQVNGKGDKTRFCKSEAEIGRRIPETHCYNADQFTQIQMKNEQEREALKSMKASGSSSH